MPRRLLSAMLALCVVAAAPAAMAADAAIEGCQIGFGGVYKLGCWTPVRVTVAGAEALETPTLEVIAPDGDGSPTVVSAEVPKSTGTANVNLVTRVGRQGADLRVRLLDGERLVSQWRASQSPDFQSKALRATSALEVWIEQAEQAGGATDKITLPPAQLPSSPLAYDGVTTLVIRAGDDPRPLTLSPERAEAIREWVRQGGRILLIGGRAAGQLIGPDGPLRELSPGTLSEVVPLNSAGVIEDYADSDKAIDLPPGAGLAMARLADVAGAIVLHAGGRAEEAPLVVRRLYGFGEVTFVAFDTHSPELLAWPGHERLMSLLLRKGEAARDASQVDSTQLVGRAYADLPGAVYVGLGSHFTGVSSISILTLVAAVAVYLALLGPGAYFFGLRVARRMQSAWFTFPAIALAVGASAWWWGREATGDQARVNQVQLVDIDTSTGSERGFMWAQVFSPAAELYDLGVSFPGDATTGEQPPKGYLTWFGLPGGGLGGMQTTAESLLSGQQRYHLAPSLDGMRGVPINRRTSKAITARWSTGESPAVQFDLDPSNSGLVEGTVANDTPMALTSVRLIADGWAWRLPDLPPGDIAVVDASVAPARVSTVLTADLNEASAESADDRGDASGLLLRMMFHRALAPRAPDSLGNRYQQACDLSHAVTVGRPILLARVSEARAELTRGSQPLDPESEPQCVYYRFVGPLLEAAD